LEKSVNHLAHFHAIRIVKIKSCERAYSDTLEIRWNWIQYLVKYLLFSNVAKFALNSGLSAVAVLIKLSWLDEQSRNGALIDQTLLNVATHNVYPSNLESSKQFIAFSHSLRILLLKSHGYKPSFIVSQICPANVSTVMLAQMLSAGTFAAIRGYS
jgi:hypothetical protein